MAVLGLLGIFILTVLQLLPILHAPLAFDDIYMPPFVKLFGSWTSVFSSDAFGFYRPVKNILYYAVEASGGSVLVYHWCTVAAYLAAILGVYSLSRRLSDSIAGGLAAAAIFAFSASNVTVASWTSCFNISVAAVSMTFGLVAWDKWRESPSRWGQAILFTLLLLLGLLSYETAIATAPAAVLIDLYRGRPVFTKGSMLRYAGIAVIVVVWLFVRHQAQAASGGGFNPSVPPDTKLWQLTASAPYFLWTHFLMWAAPWGRLECLGSYSWGRSIPVAILPFCWIFLVGTAALCIRIWKPGNLFVFGLAWFLIVSFPSGNFIPLGNTPYADYYTTIPSIGLGLALVSVLQSLWTSSKSAPARTSASRVLITCFCLLIGWRLAVVPAQRQWVVAWSQPVEVMARTAAARPYQYLAKSSVAEILSDTDYLDTAQWYAESAIKEADWLSTPHMVLGEIALKRGEYDDAIAHLNNSFKARHLSSQTILKTNLRMAQAIGSNPKKTGDAFKYYLPVLRAPQSALHMEAILSAAAMFGKANQPDKQEETLKRGLDFHPESSSILNALKAVKATLPTTSDKP